MRNISTSDLRKHEAQLRTVLRELGRNRPLRDPVFSAVEALRFTPAQVHSLLWLGVEGTLTMGEIASRLGITEKTITGVVDRLEAEAFVARVRSAQDRRVVRVKLTPKGTGIYRRFEANLGRRIRGLLMLLEPSERRALIRILEKIVERAPRAP